MNRETDAFTAFEHDGWENVCAGYETHFGRLTRQSAGALVDAAGVGVGLRVLDVCCGPGIVTAAAAARGANAVGLDFSAATVDLASSRVPQATFQQGDAQALPFQDEAFDAVVCGFGIIHLAQPEAALTEIYRVLKPGGRAAVSVWEAPGPGNGFGLLYGAIKTHADMNVPLPEGPDFFQFSGPGALDRALADCGFREPQTRSVEQFWEFDHDNGLVDAVLEGAVRARGLIRAQTDAVRDAIAGEVAAGMRAYRAANGKFHLPMPALVGAGLKESRWCIAAARTAAASASRGYNRRRLFDRGTSHENRWWLPLRPVCLPGRSRSRRGHHLPLQRLPDPVRICLSNRGAGDRGQFRSVARRAEDLRQGRRKRVAARAVILPGLRHADLLRTG